jgi:hypothetical protein
MPTLRHADRVCRLPDVLHQDGELVAPQPRHRVRGANAGPEAVGDLDQELVSREVPEAVIDDLEAVHVQKQHCEGERLAAPRPLQHAAQPVHVERPVGQVGEAVVAARERDVADGARDAGGLARGPAHGRSPANHPAVGAIAVQDPVLVLERGRLAVQVLSQRLFQAADVIRVHAPEPFVDIVGHLVLLEAQDALPPRGEVGLIDLDLPIPQPVVGARHGEGEALLAVAQRLERLGALDGVAQAAFHQRGAELAFDEVVRGARAHRFHVQAVSALGGQHDDGDAAALVEGLLQEVQAAAVPQLVVQEADVGWLRQQRRQAVAVGRLPVECEPRLRGVRQVGVHDLERKLVVVDQQDADGHGLQCAGSPFPRSRRIQPKPSAIALLLFGRGQPRGRQPREDLHQDVERERGVVHANG